MVSSVFYLCFSDEWWYWSSFHVIMGHLCIFFGEISIRLFNQFLIGLLVILLLSYKFFIDSENKTLITYMICKYFITISGLFFTFLMISLDTQFKNFWQSPHFFISLPVFGILCKKLLPDPRSYYLFLCFLLRVL